MPRSKRSTKSPAPLQRLPRFGFLLIALLLLMVAAPVLSVVGPWLPVWLISLTTTLVFTSILLTAVFAINRTRRSVLLGLALITPVFISHVAEAIWQRNETIIVDHLLSIAFLIYVIVLMTRWMFQQRDVDSNMICGSLCIYLLLGVAWSIVFSLLTVVEPASFSNTALAGDSTREVRFGGDDTVTSLYFSFVTMTTLGYGDITPTTAAARMLAVVEAIMGQLYLTVLVANLVGMHAARGRVSR